MIGSMTIRDRDRKILWARSGNRCAICRTVLVEDATGLDREAVIGEEAHIVGRSDEGPRGVNDLVDRDVYENLILLCRDHHRVVDAQPESYPAGELRRVKRSHEAWVEAMLTSRRDVAGTGGLSWPERFVNRTEELSVLSGVLDRARTDAAARVVVLTGMHGVGKSAIGRHWVSMQRAEFSDRLAACLSSGRERHPVDVSDVLGDFLVDLGTAREAVPSTLRDRSRLFAEATRSRSVVVLLDDVQNPAQVASLMPSGAGSVVIATSTLFLEELLIDDASLVTVGPLDDPVSRDLLAGMLGVSRLEAEVAAVDELIAMCAGLPLALRVCAARLLGRDRSRSIGSVVASIAEAADPLAAMSASSSLRVDAVFESAYDDLPADTKVVYRRLGALPGRVVSAPVMAQLANGRSAAVLDALLGLQASNLLDAVGDDRFGVHDLIRRHARSVAVRVDGPLVVADATGRVVRWLRAVLQRADRAVSASRLRLIDIDERDLVELPMFVDARDAFGWFDRERGLISGVVDLLADEPGLDSAACAVAEALWPLCSNMRAYSLWVRSHRVGIGAAVRLGDRAVEARLRACLARALSDQGDFGSAAMEIQLAEAAVAVCDDEMLLASIAEFSGIVRLDRGDAVGALDRFRVSRVGHDRAGSVRGVAIEDYLIGKCLMELGDYQAALAALDDAHRGCAEVGDDVLDGRVNRRRGQALAKAARLDDAVSAFIEALEIATRLGTRFDEAQALEELAITHAARGDSVASIEFARRAFTAYDALGHPRARVVSDMLLGDA
ncbi:MAG: afsR10 [Acidimicrobiales bacterium]|nr:afsR10 [Acidimicrobiales bacterium]